LVFFIHVADEYILLQFYDLYPKVGIDVEVSSGEDDVTKKSAGDDAGDGGASSANPIAPNPIKFNALGQIDPSVADRATSTNPPVGGRKRKRPPPIPKRK
jgi:hypothetical protein